MSASDSERALLNRVHQFPMDVRWGDMDAMRHVNNTLYFRFFEEARVQLFERLGKATAQGGFAVLAHISCDFLQPLMYPARIAVAIQCLRIGRSSLELESWIARADAPDCVYARGRSVVVSSNDEGRPAPWTDAERQALHHFFSA